MHDRQGMAMRWFVKRKSGANDLKTTQIPQRVIQAEAAREDVLYSQPMLRS
jgi:hypothetical protein